jgi:RNA polymerase sigma factor (TIGR02999 family)
MPSDDVTRILNDLGKGGELSEALYAELKRMAAAKMTRERAGHTLQPTALVNEAWLRLVGAEGQGWWENRRHFFGAASEAMRRILVENARRRQCGKRGGGAEEIALDHAPELALAAPQDDEKILQVHEALATLEKDDPLKAEIVRLRYFAGFTHAEIAHALALNEKTVRRHWTVAKIRLYRAIREDSTVGR